VDAEDREDAIVAAVKRGHKVVIVGYRRVSEGLNLQIVDSIIWVEMAQHPILLTQASQRAWRLGKQAEVRIFYLAYAGTVSHDKLKQLASQGGAAALFSGNAPQGGLAEHVGADQGALAQITHKLGAATDLSAAFARRHQELARAIAAGRDWLGIDHDSLPDRIGVHAGSHASPALAAASGAHAPPHQGAQTARDHPRSARAGGTEGGSYVRQPRRHRHGVARRPQDPS